MFCEGVKYLFDSLKCKSIYNFFEMRFSGFFCCYSVSQCSNTDHFFVSGQMYKISRGSNNFFPHCIMSNSLKESAYKSHLFINWFTLVEFGTCWHGKRTKKVKSIKKIFCCCTRYLIASHLIQVVNSHSQFKYNVIYFAVALKSGLHSHWK